MSDMIYRIDADTEDFDKEIIDWSNKHKEFVGQGSYGTDVDIIKFGWRSWSPHHHCWNVSSFVKELSEKFPKVVFRLMYQMSRTEVFFYLNGKELRGEHFFPSKKVFNDTLKLLRNKELACGIAGS